jgi:protein TilB
MMEQDLAIAARKNIEKKVLEEKTGVQKNGYTKEFRRECFEEQRQREEEQKKGQKENSMFKEYNEFYKDFNKPQQIPVYSSNGQVRQANQGKYEWRFDETPDKTCILFEIRIPKHLETSLINVDLNPDYLRLDIKGRITQLSIPEDILVEKSKVQRSTTTGVLQLTMPKANLTEIEAQQLRIQRKMEQREQEKKLRELERKQQEAKEKAEKESLKKAKLVDYDNDNFVIREAELEQEKEKRLAAKK